mgnify:CR=1 FL=1
MTKLEKACKDMADVCELAYERTVRECRKLDIQVDCTSVNLCEDAGQDHTGEDGTHYTREAQEVFDKHYDHICEVTGI